MPVIPVQRLLAHEARQARVRFFIDDSGNEVPAIMVFSPSWAMPLVSAYAKCLAVRAFGESSLEWMRDRLMISKRSPLGYESHWAAIDGSAHGLLRAAILTRAAQEALGYTLFPEAGGDEQRVNWQAIVASATGDERSLPHRLLQSLPSDEAIVELAGEFDALSPADLQTAVGPRQIDLSGIDADL